MVAKYLKPYLMLFYILNQVGINIILFLAVALVFFASIYLSPDYGSLFFMISYALGAGVIMFLLFRALVLATLTLYDLALLALPMQKMELKYPFEKAKARLVRVFTEKRIEYYELDRYSLGVLEMELLLFLKKTFNMNFPTILFSKKPFVLIRLYAERDANRTAASLLCDDTMDARNLLKVIEYGLKATF